MLRLLIKHSNVRRSFVAKRRSSPTFESLELRSLLSSAAVISWKMAPQIALDPAHGNAPDLPNTSAYVSPAGGYKVLLDASGSPGMKPNSTCTWTISQSGRTIATAQGKNSSVSLPEGPYTVHLTVSGVRGTSSPEVADQDIVVKDVLIVAIGDSYASGEGNPVVNGVYFLKSAQWAYSPDPAMNIQNAKAHRSTLAAPAQFALNLQANNPHEAVTFVSVADSGATIDKGLLGSMQSNIDPTYSLPGQIDEVRQIVGSHPIDILTMSIGGNDIGFSTRVEELASNSITGKTKLSGIQDQLDTDLAALPAKYAALDQAIQGLGPSNVLITEYPNPTRNQQGQYAPIRIAGLPAINKADVQFADQHILTPLNQAIETAAAANGWVAVGGQNASFRTHGYSSSDSWFRNVSQSLRVESTTIGAFHPNLKGQEAIANEILAAYDQVNIAAAS